MIDSLSYNEPLLLDKAIEVLVDLHRTGCQRIMFLLLCCNDLRLCHHILLVFPGSVRLFLHLNVHPLYVVHLLLLSHGLILDVIFTFLVKRPVLFDSHGSRTRPDVWTGLQLGSTRLSNTASFSSIRVVIVRRATHRLALVLLPEVLLAIAPLLPGVSHDLWAHLSFID